MGESVKSNDMMWKETNPLPVSGLADGIRGVGRGRVETSPGEDAILDDRRVDSGLVSGDVVLHQIQPA